MAAPFLKNVSRLSQLSRKIGIDLGTSRVRIWSDQDGFVVDEPAAIAVDTNANKVIAVGKEAQDMIGRVSKNIFVSQPLQAGVIVDPALTAAMLKVLLQKIIHNAYFFRPAIMISVPSSLTEVEKLAMTEMMYSLGGKEVSFITQILAAAIGAGVPIADASGSFFLHLGAGVVEGGIISLGSLIVSESTEYAGNYLDESVQRVLRQQKGIEVGKQSAEQIKRQIASAMLETSSEILVTGQDVLESVPKEVVVEGEVLHHSIREVLDRYVQLTKRLFEQIPSELTTDVIDKGMLLSGGLAQLRGLDSFLLSKLGVPVSVIDQPDRAVIRGIAQVLKNIDLFKESLGYNG